MKLLIVDDQILFRQNLVSALGHQPDMIVLGEACTAREALEMVGKLKPEVVLMNIHLPDGTGLDVARVLLAKRPDIKIVFLSAQDDDDQFFTAIRMGAKGFLLKTVPIPKLVMALRGLDRGEAAISREMAARLMSEMSRNGGDSNGADEPFGMLTSREMQVLREMACNGTNREIADRLFISENTVRNHVHNILEKLGLKGRREVVNLARQHGIGSIFPKRPGK
jgi:DNA-binding NarL/FixJ family response regulator